VVYGLWNVVTSIGCFICHDATFYVDVTSVRRLVKVIRSLHIGITTLPLSATYSLDYGLWKVVTCQTAAHIHHDATFNFEVINESDYRNSICAYFLHPTSGLRKTLPIFRLSQANSLVYGLWNVVTCQNTASFATRKTDQGRRQGFKSGWAKFGAKRRNLFFVCPPWFSVCPPCHA